MSRRPLYKSGRLVLQQEERRPGIGELGMNAANLIYFNDGDPRRDTLIEYKKVSTLVPTIVGKNLNVVPHWFSPNQLYAIMNGKLHHNDCVRVIVDTKGFPRLNKQGKVTIVPVVNGTYKRETVLDLIEQGMKVARLNPGVDINVEDWLDQMEGFKNTQTIHDTDEHIPDLIKQGV